MDKEEEVYASKSRKKSSPGQAPVLLNTRQNAHARRCTEASPAPEPKKLVTSSIKKQPFVMKTASARRANDCMSPTPVTKDASEFEDTPQK